MIVISLVFNEGTLFKISRRKEEIEEATKYVFKKFSFFSYYTIQRSTYEYIYLSPLVQTDDCLLEYLHSSKP